MAALGTAIMLLGGIVPVLTYVTPLAASIFLIPVKEEVGKKWGWMTWLVVSLLSVFLSADKESGFFYLFVGYYPLIKEYLDRITNRAARVLAKLGTFAAAIVAMYLILIFILALPSVIADFEGASLILNIVMIAVTVFIMLCFDTVVGFAEKYYVIRIKPKLRSIRRRS